MAIGKEVVKKRVIRWLLATMVMAIFGVPVYGAEAVRAAAPGADADAAGCIAVGDPCDATGCTAEMPKTVELSENSFEFDGTQKDPKIVARDCAGRRIASKYYTVQKPAGRTKVGRYVYTVRFKGKYRGTKKLVMRINPRKPMLTSLFYDGRTLHASWWLKNGDVAQISGYQIQYSRSDSFAYSKSEHVTIRSRKQLEKSIRNLTGKMYYVRVRSYKVVDGRIFYSQFSNVALAYPGFPIFMDPLD